MLFKILIDTKNLIQKQKSVLYCALDFTALLYHEALEKQGFNGIIEKQCII